MFSVIREFWQFAKTQKKLWLTPIVVILILVGSLLAFAQGSAIAPFIYAVF